MKQLKTLHVVRHAKSSWDYDGTADIDRTLKTKGIGNAYAISRKLKLSNLFPQKIISSPAIRALHTAVIFARVLEYPLREIEICTLMYESSPDKIMELVRKTGNECKSLMIFGHNPDFTDLVNGFIDKPIENIPTSGVVTLNFASSDWNGISMKNLESHIINFPAKDE